MPIMIRSGFRPQKQFKTFKQFNVQSSDRALEIFDSPYKAVLVPVPKRMDRGDQKVCIIGGILELYCDYVTRKKTLTSPQKPQHIAKPQYVEGSRLMRRPVQTAQNVQTVQVVKSECSRI